METLKTLDSSQRKKFLNMTTEHLDMNQNLLNLADLARQIGGSALDWMNSGFHVLQSPEFQSFVRSQIKIIQPSRSVLHAILFLCNYKHNFYNYLKSCGVFDEADKCQVEKSLLEFLNAVLKQQLEERELQLGLVDLDIVLRLTSIQSNDDVDEYFQFFKRNKHLISPFRVSFALSFKNKNKHAAVYNLIYEKLNEHFDINLTWNS